MLEVRTDVATIADGEIQRMGLLVKSLDKNGKGCMHIAVHRYAVDSTERVNLMTGQTYIDYSWVEISC